MQKKQNPENREEEILALLNLGLSNKLICEYCEIGQVSLNSRLWQLKEEKKWDGNTVTVTESKPTMLKLLAEIDGMTIIERNNAFGVIAYHKFNETLGKVMDVGKILEQLEFFTDQINTMFDVSFDSDVPQGYCDFILAFCHPQKNSKTNYNLWSAYLAKINTEEILPPTVDEFKNGNNVICDKILSDYKIWAKQFIAPHFTLQICELIKDLIFPQISMMDNEIIKAHFKISNWPISLANSAYHLTPIQSDKAIIEALKNISKGTIEIPFSFPLNWEKITDVAIIK